MIKSRMKLTLGLLFFWTAFSMASPAITPVEEAFVTVYKPILKAQGLELKIETNDDSDDYFGGASLFEGNYVISIGRNIRTVSNGKLAFTLCHEIGHLLGGEPKKPTSTWASTEGQSDFYANSVCLKTLYKSFPHLLPAKVIVPAEVQRVCSAHYANYLDIRICKQSINSTYTFFTDVWTIINYSALAKPSLTVQTPATVEKGRNYPSLQCRLEIGMAGALCGSQACVKPSCF